VKLGLNIQTIQHLDEDDEKTKEFAKNPESNNCRHVKFALNLPEVQEILQKKERKIPE